jgi:hypothetical protein
MFITIKKNVVGANKGNVIVQKRRVGLLQSIIAASFTAFEIPCSPDKKKMKFTRQLKRQQNLHRMSPVYDRSPIQ